VQWRVDLVELVLLLLITHAWVDLMGEHEVQVLPDHFNLARRKGNAIVAGDFKEPLKPKCEVSACHGSLRLVKWIPSKKHPVRRLHSRPCRYTYGRATHKKRVEQGHVHELLCKASVRALPRLGDATHGHGRATVKVPRQGRLSLGIRVGGIARQIAAERCDVIAVIS
jgi:hypothetical protein